MKPIALLLLFAPAIIPRAPFSPDDLWRLETASDPRIRPDGQWIVYADAWNDRARDAAWSNLWLVSSDGSRRRRWTEGNWRDWSPRWSPDGMRIAWLSSRGGKPQIRVRGVDAAAETELATGGATPLAFAWSAEGDALAYTALVPPGAEGAAPRLAWAPPEILPYFPSAPPSTGIFVIGTAGERPRRLAGAPPGCHGEPAWLLDGKSLAAACDAGIYLFPVSGAAPRLLTEAAGKYDSPVLSPDGRRIAYLFTERKPQSYTIRKLYVMNTDGSRVKVLSGSLDRDASDPQWSSESRTVYFLADDRGATHVYAARNDGTVRQATARLERLRGFSLADNGRAASIRSTALEAGDVVTFTVDLVSQPVTVAAPNQHLLAERDLAAVEELDFQSGGHTIQAWLIKPPGFEAARKYPLLVDVADDPRRMYGVEFQARAQIFAAAGFAVLCANPRGTPGYGEMFGGLLRTRYPGDDFDDLMRAADAAIAKGFIDPQRLHIAGGLLAAWGIGHTARFRSAIARHPIADWTVDVALAPDGSRRAAEWMGAVPWDDPDQYVKHSPIFFARNFQTPTLILAGDPDAESEELYFALQSRKVESVMIRLPSNRPGGRVAELQAILAWLGK